MAIKMDNYGNLYDDELMHYGVKGMKWNEHKKKNYNGPTIAKQTKGNNTLTEWANYARADRKYGYSTSVKNMTNKIIQNTQKQNAKDKKTVKVSNKTVVPTTGMYGTKDNASDARGSVRYNTKTAVNKTIKSVKPSTMKKVKDKISNLFGKKKKKSNKVSVKGHVVNIND